jgi:hypothetical protein
MRIAHWIAAALVIAAPCLMGGCRKSDPFATGNHTPVNEAAMPTPELSATDVISSGTDAPGAVSTPGTPPPTLAPTPTSLPPGQ